MSSRQDSTRGNETTATVTEMEDLREPQEQVSTDTVDRYLQRLGLSQNPFTMAPDVVNFYSPIRVETILVEVLQLIDARMGFALLYGDVGLGKTTICRRILYELDQQGIETALVFNTSLQGVELLREINRDFGISAPDLTLYGQMSALNAFLMEQRSEGRNCVIIIDDAQGLTVESLELVRQISNMETGIDKIVQIILIGQPELEEKLNLYSLRQLKSRIVLKREFRPYTAQETSTYIRTKIARSGERVKLEVTDRAIRHVHEASEGSPRRINVIMGRCLYAAVANNTHVVNREIAETAIQDIEESLDEVDGRRSGRPGWVAIAAGLIIALLLAVLVMNYQGGMMSNLASQFQQYWNAESVLPTATDSDGTAGRVAAESPSQAGAGSEPEPESSASGITTATGSDGVANQAAAGSSPEPDAATGVPSSSAPTDTGGISSQVAAESPSPAGAGPKPEPATESSVPAETLAVGSRAAATRIVAESSPGPDTANGGGAPSSAASSDSGRASSQVATESPSPAEAAPEPGPASDSSAPAGTVATDSSGAVSPAGAESSPEPDAVAGRGTLSPTASSDTSGTASQSADESPNPVEPEPASDSSTPAETVATDSSGAVSSADAESSPEPDAATGSVATSLEKVTEDDGSAGRIVDEVPSPPQLDLNRDNTTVAASTDDGESVADAGSAGEIDAEAGTDIEHDPVTESPADAIINRDDAASSGHEAGSGPGAKPETVSADVEGQAVSLAEGSATPAPSATGGSGTDDEGVAVEEETTEGHSGNGETLAAVSSDGGTTSGEAAGEALGTDPPMASDVPVIEAVPPSEAVETPLPAYEINEAVWGFLDAYGLTQFAKQFEEAVRKLRFGSVSEEIVERTGLRLVVLPGVVADVKDHYTTLQIPDPANDSTRYLLFWDPEEWPEDNFSTFYDKQSVMRLQRALQRFGAYHYFIDGMVGRRTVSALELFQRAVGLPQTGKPDIETLFMLEFLNPQRRSNAAQSGSNPTTDRGWSKIEQDFSE